ncbi:MAG: GntR family transcriptional regulator [Vicinamibacteria bacterium]
MERQTLAVQVYASLKKAILEGDLLPGERLKELEIAQSLGASRTPVREALSKLEIEGLLKPLSSGGLTVVELSEGDVREIFGLIRVLESHAARLAAARVTAEELSRLESLCHYAEQDDESGSERLIELNRRFHEAFIACSGSQRLQDMLSNLRAAMQPYRIVSLGSAEFRRITIRDHRGMIEALRVRDADRLCRLVEDHLSLAERTTLTNVHLQAERLAARTF